MTKEKADALLRERFEQLNEAAESTSDPAALCALADSIHKLYITMVNAGALEVTFPETPSDGSIKS